MIDYVIPVFVLLILCVSIYERKDTYRLFCSGIENGAKVIVSIFPVIFSTLILVQLLNGLNLDLGKNNSILINILPLILLRPFSGAASMGILLNIFSTYGVDSNEGVLASIIMGSSETTFYAISTYFGVTDVKNPKGVIIPALIADFTLILCGYIYIRLFF